MSKYNFEQKRSDYMTPDDFIQDLFDKYFIEERIFDLDVCCSKPNIPAREYFIDGIKDGLKEPWKKLNWMNCPFNECDNWFYKAVEEQYKGNTTYCLAPARTETKFWHKCVLTEDGSGFRHGVEVVFLQKGLCFIDPATGEKVKMKVALKDPITKEPIIDPITEEPLFKLVDGVYKNPLALVIFNGIEPGSFVPYEKQLKIGE